MSEVDPACLHTCPAAATLLSAACEKGIVSVAQTPSGGVVVAAQQERKGIWRRKKYLMHAAHTAKLMLCNLYIIKSGEHIIIHSGEKELRGKIKKKHTIQQRR